MLNAGRRARKCGRIGSFDSRGGRAFIATAMAIAGWIVVFVVVMTIASTKAANASVAAPVEKAELDLGRGQKGPVFDVLPLTASTSTVLVNGDGTCAVAGGTTQCWGYVANSHVPTPVANMPVGATSLFSASTPSGVCGLLAGNVNCPGAFNSTFDAALAALSGKVDKVNGPCAIVDGGAKCWGQGNWGQLGNGTNEDSQVPVPVTGLTSGVTDISSSGQVACAVASGAAYCWGSGYKGALGNGLTEDANTPVQVAGLTSGVTAIDVSHWPLACAVVNGGAVCWGHGRHGNAANGSKAVHTTPVQVAGLSGNVTAIGVGFKHTCVLDGGAAKCWGSGSHGQLGTGKYRSSRIPVQVSGLTSGVDAISTSYEHTCVLRSGTVSCWGQGGRGELGVPLVLKVPKSVNFSKRFKLSLSTPGYSRIKIKLKLGKKILWLARPYFGSLFTRVHRGGRFDFRLDLEKHILLRLRIKKGLPFAEKRVSQIKRALRQKRGKGSLVLTPELVDGTGPAQQPVTVKLY